MPVRISPFSWLSFFVSTVETAKLYQIRPAEWFIAEALSLKNITFQICLKIFYRSWNMHYHPFLRKSVLIGRDAKNKLVTAQTDVVFLCQTMLSFFYRPSRECQKVSTSLKIAEHVDGQGREYLSIIFHEELPYKAGIKPGHSKLKILLKGQHSHKWFEEALESNGTFSPTMQ